MSRTAEALDLRVEDVAQLERWASATGTPQQVALRCRLALGAGKGHEDQEIAFEEAVNRHTVRLWRQRVRAEGVGAVWEIREGRGRKPEYDLARRDAIITATLRTHPKGETHWSCRSMATAQGVSKNTIKRLWQLHNLKRKRSGLTLREVGEHTGVSNYKAVSGAVRRFERRIEKDATSRRLVRQCLAQL